jgi:hypothetical protein
VKTYVLLAVSIAEGALAALGEERHLGRRPGELYQKTFGQLLEVWKDGDNPRDEVAEIWEDLLTLRRYRNVVHLNRAAEDNITWQQILENEAPILDSADRVVDHLRNLSHIFRDAP